MKIALFIPCYIDQFYPSVGIACYELLQKLGYEVNVPLDVPCCGQPMANSGFEDKVIPVYENYCDTYGDYDKILMPSGSCTLHVKNHYDIIPQTEKVKNSRQNTEDIVDFLVKNALDKLPNFEFPYNVSLHTGCHSLRGLHSGHPSEQFGYGKTNLEILFEKVKPKALLVQDRKDECCGFGGTFAVVEEAISVKMGQDKLERLKTIHTEVLISNDMSCLMHLQGINDKSKGNIKVLHIIELLNNNF